MVKNISALLGLNPVPVTFFDLLSSWNDQDERMGGFRYSLKTSLNFVLRTGRSQVGAGEDARVLRPLLQM